MSYSYQQPMNYNQVTENPYYNTQVKKDYGKTIGLGCGIAGAGVGTYFGFKKDSFIGKDGTISDDIVKNIYEKHVNKSTDGTKEIYNGGKNIINKIDGIKKSDDLKKLFNTNKEAATNICSDLKQTSEEFLSSVTDNNLEANKKVIKEKIKASNNLRYQDMRNKIQACWDSEKKKLVKADSVSDDVYKTIKNTTGGIKAGTVAKYALVSAAIAGTIGYFIGKLISK